MNEDLKTKRVMPVSTADRIRGAKTLAELDKLFLDVPAGANTKTKRRIEAAYASAKKRLAPTGGLDAHA